MIDRFFYPSHCLIPHPFIRIMTFGSVFKALVRPENLLVFQVGEGWERLCEFLGHDVPDVEFPHENRAGTATSINNKYNKFDVFQRGNREAKSTVIKLCMTMSLVLIGTFAFKRTFCSCK